MMRIPGKVGVLSEDKEEHSIMGRKTEKGCTDETMLNESNYVILINPRASFRPSRCSAGKAH